MKRAIKEQQKQIKISLVADFDPYQGGDLTADPNIYTMQFMHNGGTFGIADEKQEGADFFSEDENESSHSITSFFGDISSLQEGKYEWDKDKKEWICTSCKN